MTATLQNVAVAEQLATEQKSFAYIKRILAIAVSNIAYIRGLFPDTSFTDRFLEDMRVRILKNNDDTKQLIDWMAGVYDGIEKQYIKTILLVITTDDKNPVENIVETYKFNISYEGRGNTDLSVSQDSQQSQKMVQISFSDTKKSARKLLRNLFVLTSSFEPIPEKYFVTMRLTYYDEVTPSSYQPPGFGPDVNSSFKELSSECSTHIVGKLRTPHHSMQLVVKSFHGTEDLNRSDRVAQANQRDKMLMPPPSNINTMDHQEVHNSMEQSLPTQTQDTQAQGVRCPCGFDRDDGFMLMCVLCGYWQHGICFCLTEDIAFVGTHVCNICGNPNTAEFYPTDVTLMNLSESQLRETCTWRRALLACYETSRVSITPLSARLAVPKILAKDIVNKLVLQGIAKPIKGQRSAKDIDKSKLDAVFRRDVRSLGTNMQKQRLEVMSKLPNSALSQPPMQTSTEATTVIEHEIIQEEPDQQSAKRPFEFTDDSASAFESSPKRSEIPPKKKSRAKKAKGRK